MTALALLTSLALGVGLSAACGFRVFAPLLVLSVAGMTGYHAPAEELAWMSSWPALALFGTATVVEIVAYYVPWLDNLLDTIASPAALVAGVLASASVLGELPPILQWTAAAVAGGGAAGLVQSATVLLRGKSSLATGGTANFVVATVENVLSFVTALLALIVPLLVATALVITGIVVWRSVRRARSLVSSSGSP